MPAGIARIQASLTLSGPAAKPGPAASSSAHTQSVMFFPSCDQSGSVTKAAVAWAARTATGHCSMARWDNNPADRCNSTNLATPPHWGRWDRNPCKADNNKDRASSRRSRNRDRRNPNRDCTRGDCRAGRRKRPRRGSPATEASVESATTAMKAAAAMMLRIGRSGKTRRHQRGGGHRHQYPFHRIPRHIKPALTYPAADAWFPGQRPPAAPASNWHRNSSRPHRAVVARRDPVSSSAPRDRRVRAP